MIEENSEKRILELAEKWLNGTITPDEQREYADWYNHHPNESLLIPESFASSKEEHSKRILEKINTLKKKPAPVVSMRRLLVRVSAAAAILLLICSGSYFLFFNKPKNDLAKTEIKQSISNDVAPGSNKAILTLNNGSAIVLNDVGNGTIATEGNAEVEKLADGQLAYNLADNKAKEVIYNTVSTPRGGQYKVVLPDGTQVWLNAASSIKFPTSFTENRRNVTVTGEVYMEVAKDATKPFIVSVNNSEIEVLGTHFNVMAYGNEEALETTLLEGSVKFRSGDKSILLKPGEQSRLGNNGDIKLNKDADADLITAWKNGMTAFKSTDLKTIMRQVERWYDVDVNYEGAIASRKFTGEIPRDVKLSALLKLLEASKIKFTIDGTNKKLTIKS